MRVADSGGTLGFAAFLEYTEKKYGMALRVRELPGCQLVCYHSAVVARRNVPVIVDALIDHDGRACDLLYVPEVERGGASNESIRQLAARRGWYIHSRPGLRAPYLPLENSWDAFLAGRSSSFRYTLRRKQKALNGLGAVTQKWFTDTDCVSTLLAHVRDIEEASWKVDAAMAISRSTKETSYYSLLLPWLAQQGALQANVLFVGDRPAAYSLCYVWQGRMAQMKTSFSEAFADASPGLVTTASTIERAHELGLQEFDFLGDMMPHKAVWTNLTRDHDHLYVYTAQPRARIAGLVRRLISAVRPADVVTTVGRSGHRPTAPKH